MHRRSRFQFPLFTAEVFGQLMYPTKAEFENMLRNRSFDSILSDIMFAGLPYFFLGQPELHDEMIEQITDGLGVPAVDVCVVGSARIGFSLAPQKFGTPFNEHSDIDVLVVSADLFDQSWLDILANRRVRWATLRARTKERLVAHQSESYIYNGWIYPDSIAEALAIGQNWLRTFNGLSRIPALSSRPVNSRLYRTWEHAEAYHRRGLRRIRNNIVSS